MVSDGPRRGGPPGGGELPWQVQIGMEMRAARDLAAAANDTATGVSAQLAEALPRLGDIEDRLTALAGALETDGDDASAPVPGTPALRWSRLPPDLALTAWEALADWVARVLNGDYRLSRVELPDCWPVHPRAVRELAWLRTSYLAASTGRARPDVVADWHGRWLPLALSNLAAAIDQRECAPGRHRLTDEERRRHEEALDEADRTGQPEPPLTTQTGPDRPRYLPHRFPPRRSYDQHPPWQDPAARPRPRSLDDDTPPPASTRDCWWEYYLDARDADLAQRRRAAP